MRMTSPAVGAVDGHVLVEALRDQRRVRADHRVQRVEPMEEGQLGLGLCQKGPQLLQQRSLARPRRHRREEAWHLPFARAPSFFRARGS